jgi:hypothetical protein
MAIPPYLDPSATSIEYRCGEAVAMGLHLMMRAAAHQANLDAECEALCDGVARWMEAMGAE